MSIARHQVSRFLVPVKRSSRPGNPEAVEEDRANEAKPHYVALGAVPKADDRWLHLIDRAESCAFQWDTGAGRFVELA